MNFFTSECVNCGCTDTSACMTSDGPCSWLRVDEIEGVGVCSGCPQAVQNWDMGRACIPTDEEIELVVAKNRSVAHGPFILQIKDNQH